jgi:nucleoside-triphosphatase THEP1
MNVHARHLFEMEATGNEKEKLFVGHFAFSKAHFDKAIQIIRDARDKSGWLIIDEIGPMELRGEGFREVVKEVIASENEMQKIVLVVREELVDNVKESFHIQNAVVIDKASDLV